MRSSGCHIDRDLTQHAVVGLLEVLPKLRQFFRFASEAEAVFGVGKSTRSSLSTFRGSTGTLLNGPNVTAFRFTTTVHRNSGLGVDGECERCDVPWTMC